MRIAGTAGPVAAQVRLQAVRRVRPQAEPNRRNPLGCRTAVTNLRGRRGAGIFRKGWGWLNRTFSIRLAVWATRSILRAESSHSVETSVAMPSAPSTPGS